MSEKRFPIQGFPLGVPWSAAERAYEFYAEQYGKSQSLERLAERGGFDLVELAHFYLRKHFRDDHAFDVRYIGEALTEILRRAAAPEISDAMVELRERYIAYKVTVLEDTVDDTTASLERRDDALGWLLVAVDAALEARKEGE